MDAVDLVGPRGTRIRCAVASTRRERRRGLIGREPLADGEALLLPRATSVHTFGMAFAIGVVRVDRAGRVVDVRVVPPRRLVAPTRRARHVLECAAGIDVRVGDVLRVAQAGQPPRPAAPVTTHDPAWFSSFRFTPRASSSVSSLA
ncbi:MAG: DUF192 domain-containing protein [Actinomycetota bacterium]